jgi:hypothetical protein
MDMAFQPKISVFGQASNHAFQTLVAQGVHTVPQLGMKLAATTGSELFLGDVDNSKFTGDFTKRSCYTRGMAY